MLNFFDSMKIRDGLTATPFIITLYAVLLISIIILVMSLYHLCKTKSLSMEAEMKLRALQVQKEQEEPIDPFYDRIESCTKLFSLITNAVGDEIVYTIYVYSSLGQPYPIAKLDKDIENIASIVYKGINPEIISSKNMVFKPEYVMSMITKITTNSLIQTVREYNASINNAKMEE